MEANDSGTANLPRPARPPLRIFPPHLFASACKTTIPSLISSKEPIQQLFSQHHPSKANVNKPLLNYHSLKTLRETKLTTFCELAPTQGKQP